MSRRTKLANKAVRLAWIREKELVEKGQGTRNWTTEQQKDILERGKAYDEYGKAFEGHHMKNVENFPDYQGNPDNIQFLTRSEHYYAHDGKFGYSNWYYDPVEKTRINFGDSLIKTKEIDLSEPVVFKNSDIEYDNEHEKTIKNNKKETNTIKDGKQQKAVVKPKKETNAIPKKKGLKHYFGKAIDFYQNNKETINPIMKTVVREGVEVYLAYKAGKSTNHRDKKSTNKTNKKSLVLDEIVKSSLDVSKRNSPEEHIVPSHRQRYGKDKIWKEKKSYKRGGKKDD